MTPQESHKAEMQFVYRSNRGEVNVDLMGLAEHDYIVREITREQSFYEDDLLEYLALAAPKGGVFIDVGANIGNHSVYFGKFIADHVVAIEPSPDLAAVLHRNLEVNKISSTILVCGLGKEASSGHLQIPSEFRSSNSGAGHIVVDRDVQASPAQGPAVKVRTLDEVVRDLRMRDRGPISLVKIDVEGTEWDVLAGAREVIEQDRPHLVIELLTADQFRKVANWLAQFGYRNVARLGKSPTYHFVPASSEVPSLLFVAENDETLTRFQLTLRDMASVIPSGESYILAGWGGQFLPERRALDFGTHDGVFSEPADDAAAVTELRQLHESGARFVVFPWPAFWWLEYYIGMRQYLLKAAARLCDNQRLIVFRFEDSRC
jgi:FkbM family methyltransferase